MFLSGNLFEKALDIGFTIGISKGEINHISLPCIATTADGRLYEFCQLNYLPNPDAIPGNLFGAPTIEKIKLSTIELSPFAMPLDLRIASTNPEEYRNDFPFFIMLKNGNLLGYNAAVPVDFISYDKKYKTSDVERRVLIHSGERPLDKTFQFIKHMDTSNVQIATFILTNRQLIVIEQLANR